jgi:hypothetical protein
MKSCLRYNNHSPSMQEFDAAWLLLCLAQVFVLGSCQKHPETTASRAVAPPDLRHCTKIEVHYLPSVLELFFYNDWYKALLNPMELSHIQSTEGIVVDDRERINRFAETVASGTPGGPTGATAVGFRARVICYRDGERVASLRVYPDAIWVEDGGWFEYSQPEYSKWRGPLMGTLLALTPDIWALELRRACADNLSDLRAEFDMWERDEKVYPSAPGWCDAIIHRWQQVHSSDYIKRYLTCPSVSEGQSHYAMNPNCEPNSPADTVLLFETRAGWNQHGGPELFTFDNHDPKGGLVLLNDGTVKFIRTEEELKQLRWK